MTRAVPQTPPSQAPYEVTLTCRRTCNTWFLELHPGTDAAAWIAEHTGKRPSSQRPVSVAHGDHHRAVADGIHGHLMRAVYLAVVQEPGTSTEIARRIGRQRSSVSGRLSELVGLGHLIVRDGRYHANGGQS